VSKRRVNKPIKHHYIPVFYLKSWASDDSKLCEFSRPYKKVIDKRRYPAETGFKNYLYSVPGLPEEEAQYIETHFMQMVDTRACDAYRKFLEQNQDDLVLQEADSWSRFLYAIIFRNPENIASMEKRYKDFAPIVVEEWRERYPRLRKPTDPDTFDEFKTNFLASPYNTSGMHVIPRMLNSDRVISRIRSLTFWTVQLGEFDFPKFLTSDRPIIMNSGLEKPAAHIIMPLSPRVLFISARGTWLYDNINNTPRHKLAKAINFFVTRQSHNYVYGESASQLPFVSKYLGQKVASTPFG
jgi:hypothetical protein